MRIGFYLDSVYIPAWMFNAIENALTLENSVPYVLIREQGDLVHPDHNRRHSKRTFLCAWARKFAFHTYMAWENKWLKKRYINEKNDAFLLKDIRKLIPHHSIINLSSIHSKDILKKTDVETVKELQLDVLFCGGLPLLNTKMLPLPTYGVWLYHFGDPKIEHPYMPGFIEIYNNEGTVMALLVRLTEHVREGELLAQARIPINEPHFLSWAYNSLAWDSSALLPLCLKKMAQTGTPYAYTQDTIVSNLFDYKIPGFFSTLGFAAQLIYKRMRQKPGTISQYWSIRIAKNEPESDKNLVHQKKFITLKNPAGTFRADPFLFNFKNKEYLFFEEFDYKKLKGVIKVGEINTSGFIDAPITILEDEFHFSNPYVFYDEETIYLLPEHGESGEIALYKCIEFPGKWEKVLIILQGAYYADPILLKTSNKWWLFCIEKMAQFGAPTVYGKLFFSESLKGPWSEHPMSPISMDCRFSRSAGAVFEEGNQFIRVVQDCSQGYGYKIHFLKITQLSETQYEDELIGTLEPELFNSEGIHSISFSKNLIAIDVRHRIRREDL